MSNGNKRYLGDVFLNAENYERQKQFLKDIIESYQYKYGGSFDAATLQGRVPGDFATREQGEKADRALLEPILLGRKRIENISDSQYIYTDATLLDRESELIDAIPWFDNLENDDLTDALKSIYDNVIYLTNDLYRRKLDKSIFDDFFENDYSPLKQVISRAFQTVIDWNGDEITVLNADLVNGLRFILITQDAYDALPSEKKTFWRNIFIIRDANEIPADYSSPFNLDLTDGYEFRVHDGMLQVSNVISNNWKNVCSLEDLLSGTDLDGLIKVFIEEQEYIIQTDSLIESLKLISRSDVDSNWTNFPFLSSSLHDDFIKNITINGQTTGITYTTDPNTNFTTADLVLGSYMEEYLNPVNTLLFEYSNELANAKTNIDFLLNESSTLTNGLNQVSNVNSDQNETLEEINKTLLNINGQLRSLSSSIENTERELEAIHDKSTWKHYRNTDGAKQESDWAQENTGVNLWVNEFLGIGLIRVKATVTSDAKNWTRLENTSGLVNHEWPALPDKYKPIWDIPIPTTNPKFEVKIADDDDETVKNRSKILYKSSMGATPFGPKTGLAMGFYRFKQ